MNCLEVDIQRVGGLDAKVERVGAMTCTVRRVSDFSVRIGLVCTTDLGELGIIWASDGKLITLEGGYLIGA